MYTELLGFSISDLCAWSTFVSYVVHVGSESISLDLLCAGNFYSHLVNDSVDAANLLGKDLTSAVKDIQALHRPFFTSSLPAVMQDMFINSLSHIRSNKYLLIMIPLFLKTNPMT